jgi:hypothetical protein
MEGGLDFLLRQVVVVACTCLEAYFWDIVRENVLTIVQARTRRADKTLLELQLTLEDYISLQQYDDPDMRLQQIILKNFQRRTLYGTDSIDQIAKLLTLNNYWGQVEHKCGADQSLLKKQIGDLTQRRNQIAHRADRPDEPNAEVDAHGLRPITFAWTNLRVQAARTLVSATAEIVEETMTRLQGEIQAMREQEAAQRLARGAAAGGRADG